MRDLVTSSCRVQERPREGSDLGRVGERIDQRQCRRRTAQLGHRDGAVERDHRRGLEALERPGATRPPLSLLGVELLDLRPVCVFEAGGARVERRDGGLDLVRSRAPVAESLVEQR